jgi:thioredoxin-related protein
MKKIIPLLILSSLSLSALEWLSYDEGVKLQEKNHKVIMIDVVRTECHYCIEMEKNVFDDKEMATWLSERFIPVKVNLDLQKMPLGIKTSFTPSFFFIGKDKKILKKIPGSWGIRDFKELTEGIK